MGLLLRKFQDLLSRRSDHASDSAKLDETVRNSFQRTKSINPETDAQWFQLQRRIAQVDTTTARYRPRLIPRLAFALSVMALAAIGVYYFTHDSSFVFSTQRGEQRALTLDDGSEVTLSYSTKLVVPSSLRSATSRRVSLRGEAFFRVRSSNTPFIVSTSGVDIEVVGTEFNVRARESMVEVGVIEGSVNVRTFGGGRDSSVLLRQRQMVVVRQDGFARRVEEISSSHYPGWMHGKLLLNRSTLFSAIREIEMRFGITIRFTSQRSRSDVITGIVDAQDAEAALRALCALTGKSFKREGDIYTVF